MLEFFCEINLPQILTFQNPNPELQVQQQENVRNENKTLFLHSLSPRTFYGEYNVLFNIVKEYRRTRFGQQNYGTSCRSSDIQKKEEQRIFSCDGKCIWVLVQPNKTRNTIQ